MIEIKSFGKLRSLIGVDGEKLEKIADKAVGHYSSFDTRVGDGKWRHIDNPKEDLKSIQTAVLHRILRQVSLPHHMYGTKRGGSIQAHAAHHVGQECVLTLDLRNCYPRTSNDQVHDAFLDKVGCSPAIARVLTKLCTVDHRLPQGAPTSGYLAHLALLDLYAELRRIARRHGLRLSLYVDDIALSGTTGAVAAAIGPTIAVIERFGHSIRNKKKLVMVGDARAITGLRVLDHLEVPAAYIADLEAELIAAAKAGTVSLTAYDQLRGRVQWVAQIWAPQASPLAAILREVSPGTERHKTFATRVPCKGKGTCRWWQETQLQYRQERRVA